MGARMDFPTQVGAETGPVFRLRGRGPSGRLGSQERQEERAAYLFLLPWFAGLLFFLAIPLLWSVYMSMTDEQLLRPGKFVGLSNYVYMFTGDRRFYKALQVTFT
jgi:multiple sugar transport system permease protein